MIRFKKKSKIFDIVITALAGMCSVGVMLYGVWHFGLEESYEELVLNVFYLACLVMMWMYFFNRLEAQRFNYWCSVCVGITVLLRDILFPPPLAFQPLQLACLTLSVLLLLHHRLAHCRTLQLRYLSGTHQQIYRLSADRNLDSSHHHLWAGDLFRVGNGK